MTTDLITALQTHGEVHKGTDLGGVLQWAILHIQSQAEAIEELRADFEPFGYFKAEPFGWRDCAETDEGAIALYEAPQPQADARDEEREKLLRALYDRGYEDRAKERDYDPLGASEFDAAMCAGAARAKQAAATGLLEFAKEWLSRQGGDDNYMTAKCRAAIAEKENK